MTAPAPDFDAAREASPTHQDWQRAKFIRDGAAMDAVWSLVKGKRGEAMQHALKAQEQADVMWAISRALDGPGYDCVEA